MNRAGFDNRIDCGEFGLYRRTSAVIDYIEILQVLDCFRIGKVNMASWLGRPCPISLLVFLLVKLLGVFCRQLPTSQCNFRVPCQWYHSSHSCATHNVLGNGDPLARSICITSFLPVK